MHIGIGAARPGPVLAPEMCMSCTVPRHAWASSAIRPSSSRLYRFDQRLAASSAESAQPDDRWAPSPPSPPAGQTPAKEPRDELERLVYHTKRFFLNPLPYFVDFGRFCASSVSLTREFYCPPWSAVFPRALGVLVVVAAFCIAVAGIDGWCAGLQRLLVEAASKKL